MGQLKAALDALRSYRVEMAPAADPLPERSQLRLAENGLGTD
jgi:hypothetical protein